MLVPHTTVLFDLIYFTWHLIVNLITLVII